MASGVNTLVCDDWFSPAVVGFYDSQIAYAVHATTTIADLYWCQKDDIVQWKKSCGHQVARFEQTLDAV